MKRFWNWIVRVWRYWTQPDEGRPSEDYPDQYWGGLGRPGQ